MEDEVAGKSLQERVAAAAARRLFAENPEAQPWPGYPHYAAAPAQVLVPGWDPKLSFADLNSGDGSELVPRPRTNGSELPPKFSAAHSSSALLVNTLGPFRTDPSQITLGPSGAFNALQFEKRLPTGAAAAHANLDAVFSNETAAVAIEAKFSEFLSVKRAKFSPKYNDVMKDADSRWRDLHRRLLKTPDLYRHLDAAQLVKHYLGVRGFYGAKAVLVYLFWEPTDATRWKVFRRHAKEAHALEEELSKADVPLVCMRYAELWDQLRTVAPEHIARVEARYRFALSN